MDPFHHIIFARSDCPPCPQPPPCACASNEQCVSLSRGCNTCGSNTCVPVDDSPANSGHAVSPGAIAGAVIASVIFIAVIVLAYFWYRRRQRLQGTATAAGDTKADQPARAEDVLGRPDPNEKPESPAPQELQTVRIYGGPSSTTINLDPQSRGDSVAAMNGHLRMSTQSNPFTDTHLIQSASTGTRSNVIPIALVPPGSVSLHSDQASTQATSGSAPQRPDRYPDVDISFNQSTANSSDSSLNGNKHYAKSTRSGMTAWRNSYMTTGSFASDLLNESPVIITPTRGTVKHVVGLVKPEVVRTPPSTSSVYSHDDSESPASASPVGSRPPVRSPLAGNGFGPLESMAEVEQEQELSVRNDPFGDEHSPYTDSGAPSSPAPPSPAATSATFGGSEEQHWDPQSPRLPWSKSGNQRPASVNTQAASIISANIGTASRVHLGLDQLSPQKTARGLLAPPSSDLPHTPISAPLSTARSQYRMTSAKIVSPPVGSNEPTPSLPSGALERQQKRAFEELDVRMSRASVLSTSTRADSILEGFPFVPPSPISDRPIRTPPRSPLAQQNFGNPPSTASTTAISATSSSEANEPLSPPNRKVLGMSTGSQLSTMSNGLSSFPFQIDSGNGPESPDSMGSPPSSFGGSSVGRQRASLDTLALTSDLSSYPLGFDRNEAMANYPGAVSRR